MLTPSGCKDIRILKIEFVTKAQFLCGKCSVPFILPAHLSFNDVHVYLKAFKQENLK